jgi:hypothetical protein
METQSNHRILSHLGRYSKLFQGQKGWNNLILLGKSTWLYLK